MRHASAAFVLAACLLAASPLASAADPAVEASMQVTGTIEIDARGKVTGYELAHAGGYPDGIVDLLAGMVPAWRFEPVLLDGQPVAARADMYLLFVARKASEDSYAIGLRGITFGDSDSEGSIRVVEQKAPQFPLAELKERATGITYVVVRIGADGQVADTFAEQTNLYKLGSAREMRRWRRDFEHAAEVALRDWTFELSGDAAAQGGTTVRIPVAFTNLAQSAQQEMSGHWQAYIPGEFRRAPWLESEYASQGVDALPSGRIQEVGSGLKLLTPLNAG